MITAVAFIVGLLAYLIGEGIGYKRGVQDGYFRGSSEPKDEPK